MDWVNPPDSIYCLYYLSGHLRLFNLHYTREKFDYLRARDQKKHVLYTRIWEPDSEDEKKTRLQEKPDAEMKNNYACRILGK